MNQVNCVQVYDSGDDDVKLNGVYEFIGVLSRAPELAVAHSDAAGGCSCAARADGAHVVHMMGCAASQELLMDELLAQPPTSLVSKMQLKIINIPCFLAICSSHA